MGNQRFDPLGECVEKWSCDRTRGEHDDQRRDPHDERPGDQPGEDQERRMLEDERQRRQAIRQTARQHHAEGNDTGKNDDVCEHDADAVARQALLADESCTEQRVAGAPRKAVYEAEHFGDKYRMVRRIDKASPVTPPAGVAAVSSSALPKPIDTSERIQGSRAAQARAPEVVTAAVAATRVVAGPAQTLRSLVEAYFEDYLAHDAIAASYVGDDRYNDRMQDYASPSYAAEALALEQKYLDAAKAIDPSALDGEARLTYDVFVHARRDAIAALRFPGYLLPLNQLDSLTSTFAVFGSGAGAQPFKTEKDYDDFLKRTADFVRWSQSAIESMREGLRRGVTIPREQIAQVVPQLREIASVAIEDNLFWQPIKDMPASFSPATRERLTQAYREMLGGALLPAYTKLADFIANDYAPRARQSVGWSALPDGKAWYAERVRNQTTTQESPEAIHALGLEQVALLRGEMDVVRQSVGFEGDLHAFFAYVQNDPKFYFENATALLDAYRALKQRIDAVLPSMFSLFPAHDYVIREVEPFRAASSSGAFYEQPSADGSRPGVFYVNTYNLKAQPKFGMETLSLHEAAPGHHFQLSIQQERNDLPTFRRFAVDTAFVEGWALYCESLGRELGLYTDPYAWYGHLSDGMLRAMRLVVDTGLHAKGWTRQQAIDYMLDNSSMARSDVEAEVDRYIVTPGQALSYKIGELRIRAARERAAKALGELFDLAAFHALVLRSGSLPLDILDANVDKWVANQLEHS